MELERILATVSDLCDSPISWVILAVIALRAAWSVMVFLTCPVANRRGGVDPDQAQALLGNRVLHSNRFLLAMIVGLALAIGGLYALRSPEAGPLALAAVLFGSFLLIVEPSRLSIEENTLRVSAARRHGDEGYAFMLDRLRAAHWERIVVELCLLAVFTLVVLTI